MTIVSQKARYRRRASLCYELATMLDGEKVAAMVHLGDIYSGLAATPDPQWAVSANSSVPDDPPECPHCRRLMRRTHVADATDRLPALERYQCHRCGERLICKQN